MDSLYCWLECIKSCSLKLNFNEEVIKIYERDLMKCKISDDGIRFEYTDNCYSLPYDIGTIAEFFKIAYQDE